jgi:hypothetical protein
VEHLTPDAAEGIRCMMPVDLIMCAGCIATAWGVLLIALL